MLTRNDDCPLHLMSAPTSPRCVKCKFFKVVEYNAVDGNKNIVCQIDEARSNIRKIIGYSTINTSASDIAFKITEMLVEMQLLVEEESENYS